MIREKYSLKKLFLVTSLFGGTVLFAQTKVTGIVQNDNGPVVNATVNVKGTNITTSTDANGLYELIVEPGKYSIVVTAVGESATEQSIDVMDENEFPLDFLLQSINEQTDLSEVVLIGSRSVGRTQLDSSTPRFNRYKRSNKRCRTSFP